MEKPTEEMKQAVIAYFKEQGLELYNVEGVNQAYAELKVWKDMGISLNEHLSDIKNSLVILEKDLDQRDSLLSYWIQVNNILKTYPEK